MSKATTGTNLDGFREYLRDQFDGNMIELIDYMNYSIQVIHRNIDRSVEPVLMDGVLDGLMRLNGAFIRCAHCYAPPRND